MLKPRQCNKTKLTQVQSTFKTYGQKTDRKHTEKYRCWHWPEMICSFFLSKATARNNADSSLFEKLVAVHGVWFHALSLQYPIKYNTLIYTLHTAVHTMHMFNNTTIPWLTKGTCLTFLHHLDVYCVRSGTLLKPVAFWQDLICGIPNVVSDLK